jgi:hypothetical protein
MIYQQIFSKYKTLSVALERLHAGYRRSVRHARKVMHKSLLLFILFFLVCLSQPGQSQKWKVYESLDLIDQKRIEWNDKNSIIVFLSKYNSSVLDPVQLKKDFYDSLKANHIPYSPSMETLFAVLKDAERVTILIKPEKEDFVEVMSRTLRKGCYQLTYDLTSHSLWDLYYLKFVYSDTVFVRKILFVK